jgi:HAD superfamily hydrolase (TIGR01662 family)
MAKTEGALPFRYVLFDLGSTLIYFEGDWAKIMETALQEATAYLRSQGLDLDEQAFPEAYYALIQEYYQKRNDTFVEYTSAHVLEAALRAHSLPAPAPDVMRQALRVLYGVTQAHWRREEDAIPALRELLARGCRLGIVSNAADDEDVQTLVDNAGLRSYFDFILTSARAGVRKPSPRIFQQALAFWNAAPEQTVMVGDTVAADVAGANALGIASVWIVRRGDTPENRAAARQTPPGAAIYALSELPALLEQWKK